MKHHPQGFAERDIPLANWLTAPHCGNSLINSSHIRTIASKAAVISAYEAHLALVRTLVPPSQLLDIDVTKESANTTWHRLAAFLQKPLPSVACLHDDCQFPELVGVSHKALPGTPSECRLCVQRRVCREQFKLGDVQGTEPLQWNKKSDFDLYKWFVLMSRYSNEHTT
mmetsp:Transcript_2349/g.3947  ORF Transcript_2349/g.3947 Transcript_2349/m.3947 type:complete len:169 (+) Transcript_2349:272-778(+)